MGVGVGGHEGQFSRDPLQVFAAGGPCEQFWYGQMCPLFAVVHPAFPLLTMASPSLQGALKDGFGEAIMACDMSEPCKFPTHDSCQKEVPVDPVPMGSPSNGGDVALYVFDINQPSLPTHFHSVLVSISVFMGPFQLYFIP